MSADTNVIQKKGAAAQNIADVLYHVGMLSRADYTIIENFDNPQIENYLKKTLKISDEVILKAYSVLFNLPIVALDFANINPSALSFLTKDELKKYEIIPYNYREHQLDIAVADPMRLQSSAPGILAELMTKHKVKISLALLPKTRFDRIIDNYSGITAKVDKKSLHDNPIKKIFEELHRAQNRGQIAKIQPKQWLKSNIPFVDLTNKDIPLAVITRFPEELARKYKIVVFETYPPKDFKKPPKMIKVAIVNPEDPQVKSILNFVKTKNNIEIEEFVTSPNSLESALKSYHKDPRLVVKKQPIIEDAPIQKAVPKPVEQKPKENPVNYKAKEIEKNFWNDIKNSPEGNVKQNTHQNKGQTNSGSSSIKEFFSQEKNKLDPEIKKLETEKKPAVKELNYKPDLNNVKKTTIDLNQEEENEKNKQSQPQDEKIIAPEGVISISPSEIQIRPEGGDEGQNLQSSLEETNLDKFLKKSVTTPRVLAESFVQGLVPQIVASTVSFAVESKASDVHIEPQEKYLRIRYRIDGELKEIIRVPMFLHAAIISRIKILSKMKIDEQRIPQDGRFNVQVENHRIDLRVSSLPTVYGEKMVLRVLDKSSAIFSLEQMGVTGSGFDALVKNINKPYGIILATGPTGSGKSTTLYAVLQRVSKPGVNIITLEDPVEYELEGINQCQVKPKIGFTFAEGLRSVLRQDPNIIMVGEIRDLETASLATHAALTGHLVLSTLHTNDAAGALPRLINMGVEPFLITSSINAVVAQRLVRKICQNCKEEYILPEDVKKDIKDEIAHLQNIKVAGFDEAQLKFYHGKGCDKCTNGYKGRIGIYEVLSMSEKIEELAVKKAPASEIAKQAIAEGMLTIKQDGILKALKGITTIDEVLRVTMKA